MHNSLSTGIFRRWAVAVAAVVLAGMMACCSDGLQTPELSDETASEALLPGVLNIKWDTAVTECLERLDAETAAAFVDSLLPEVKVTSAHRIFTGADRFEPRTRAAGLHQWYEVSYEAPLAITRGLPASVRPAGALCVETPVNPVPLRTPLVPAVGLPIRTRASGPVFDDPYYEEQWYLRNDGMLTAMARRGEDIRIEEVWPRWSGSPEVIVAVLDGAVDASHPDLAANMWVNEAERDGVAGRDDDGNGYADDVHGYNFFGMKARMTPDDHGTHVAGIIGAVNNNGIGICGIAGGDGSPDSGVRIMTCQILEDNKLSFYSNIVEKSLKYAADNGAVICNNSWAYDVHVPMSQSEKDAIDYFVEYAGVDENGDQTGPMRGGLVVFAAGNIGTSEKIYPPAYEQVVAVAGLDPAGRLADYSSYGPWVDISAYGGFISEEIPEEMLLSTVIGGEYAYAAGTSMAAPQVAGVAALLVGRYGGEGFTVDRLKEMLLHTHDRVYDANPAFVGQLGAGVLDAALAMTEYPADWEPPRTVLPIVTDAGYQTLSVCWPAVSDAAGLPVAKYRVAWQPDGENQRMQSAAIYLTDEDLLQTELHYTVDGLRAGTSYRISVVAVDGFQRVSQASPVTVSTKSVAPPRQLQPVPPFYAEQSGAEYTLSLSSYFAHEFPLQYAVSTAHDGIVTAIADADRLTVRAVGYGRTTLTLTVSVENTPGLSVSIPVVVRHDGQLADIYPNPASDVVHVALGCDATARVRIAAHQGSEVFDQELPVGIFAPAVIDVSRLGSGLYDVSVEVDGEVMQTTLLKR
ncbi:MAG: S8 family serine peptidase [Bacteroidales bacterium]|nr:S8 family serine peptidase [Bacteroidales bacterium]